MDSADSEEVQRRVVRGEEDGKGVLFAPNNNTKRDCVSDERLT